MSSNESRDHLVALLEAHKVILHSDGVSWTCQQCPDRRYHSYFPHDASREHQAEVLLALGWRPPPRVIETASVLRDESHGTVIRFRDGTVAAVDTAGGHWPGRVMTLENPVYYWHLTDGDTELFPALVLWEPEEPAGEPHRIDVTHVAPGELERMARSGARPSPELRAAIDRARDRKGTDRG